MKRALLRVLPLAGVLLAVGTSHFLSPRPFDAMMPSVLPEPTHRPLTYASGAAEILTGALLVNRRTRRIGGWLAAGVFLAVWPANIQAALAGGYPGLPGFWGSAAAAWLRVPLQVPLIAWAAWIGRGAGDPVR